MIQLTQLGYREFSNFISNHNKISEHFHKIKKKSEIALSKENTYSEILNHQ